MTAGEPIFFWEIAERRPCRLPLVGVESCGREVTRRWFVDCAATDATALWFVFEASFCMANFAWNNSAKVSSVLSVYSKLQWFAFKPSFYDITLIDTMPHKSALWFSCTVTSRAYSYVTNFDWYNSANVSSKLLCNTLHHIAKHCTHSNQKAVWTKHYNTPSIVDEHSNCSSELNFEKCSLASTRWAQRPREAYVCITSTIYICMYIQSHLEGLPREAIEYTHIYIYTVEVIFWKIYIHTYVVKVTNWKIYFYSREATKYTFIHT